MFFVALVAVFVGELLLVWRLTSGAFKDFY